ncbi:hypothetical protein LCGC14_0548430 [marine sediment metagenome]|uniref:Uncharacterized protein n=1 Tax=marine sediment metagenome TaxID=412755 RepID=A0A0F9S9B8_9ZZZZ
MKKEKEAYNKTVKDYIDKLSTPIFEKVLQEDLSNSMTTTKKTFCYFWRPNNFRRQIPVKEKTNSTSTRIKGTISKLPMELNINDHTKLISIKNFKPNITIQYGRTTLTAIYSQSIIAGEKEIFRIERNSINEINARIDEIKQNIQKKVDSALKEFSHQFDLSIPFKKPVWSRYEDFLKGEEFIDKIPRECIIHDTFFKKVYGKGIEFKKAGTEEPTVHLKNYIKNRAIEDIAPEIAASLNQLSLRFNTIGDRIIDMMNNRLKVDTELLINIRTHNKVFKKLDNLLSQKDLRKWL